MRGTWIMTPLGRSGWMRAAGLALLLAACDARGLLAQRVDGQLKDAETGAPISGATLDLLDDQGQVAQSTRSDSRGVFSLRAPRPGLYRIRASRLGYREATSQPVDLVAATTRAVDLRLSSGTVQLEPLVVTGIPRYERLEESGFYERRDHFGPDGLREGQFLEQHDIERLNPFRVEDIFNHVRGVRRDGQGQPKMRGGCSPAIVINGFLAQSGSSRRSYQSINRMPRVAGREIPTPAVLVGMEIYTGLAIPARYLLDAAGCGVIMFWTK